MNGLQINTIPLKNRKEIKQPQQPQENVMFDQSKFITSKFKKDDKIYINSGFYKHIKGKIIDLEVYDKEAQNIQYGLPQTIRTIIYIIETEPNRLQIKVPEQYLNKYKKFGLF